MKRFLPFFICFFILNEAYTQTPDLVKNVNPQDQGSGFSGSKAYLGTDYVFISHSQLWKTDGTTAGTVIIKDLTDDNISNVSRLITLGTNVLFYVKGTTNQLWKTDGTESGTLLVKDFGTYNVMINKAVAGNNLFFTASNKMNGEELWKTDGTDAGTTLVKDIEPGTASSNPRSLQNLGGVLLFFATPSSTGTSLWRSDGTEAGTTMVKDLEPTSTSFRSSGEMTVAGSKVFFNFDQTTTGKEAWVSDGTDAGTFLLKDIYPGTSGSFADKFTAINDTTVCFIAQDATNRQLWKTDGTTDGTVPFFDLTPASKNDSYAYLTNCNGKLYFAAASSLVSSTEAYISDGTTSGTTSLKPGFNGSDARGFQYLNGFVYFIGYTAATGYELWKTDGTGANTAILKEIIPGPGSGIGGSYNIEGVLNNLLLFSGVDPVYNAEPFVSDGTPDGTMLLKNIDTQGLGGYPSNITAIGNRMYFRGINMGFGNAEPWYSDGTETGTQLLKELEPVSYSNPFDFTNIDNTNFYFNTYNGRTNNIYKSDGTETGTLMIIPDVRPYGMVLINDILFFTKRTGTEGIELWKYQSDTSSLVKDINSGSLHSAPSSLTAFNNQLFFFANDGSNGRELWKSNGTEAGTSLVADIYAGSRGSDVNKPMLVFGGSLYFFADNGNNNSLMKSNGTSTGTVVVKEFTDDDDLGNFYVFDNHLFFIKKNTNTSDQVNVECWKTDGTTAGTVLLKEILPFTSGTDIDYLNVISFFTNGNLFYFYLDIENLSEETLKIGFWRSDGNTAGTYELKSYTFPQNEEGDFENDTRFVARYDNNNVLFVFEDAEHGKEIWKSDGTVEGTALAVEMVPGVTGSNPSELLNFGDAIYFSAASGDDFNELWKIVTSSATPLKLLSFNAVKGNKIVALRWNTTNEVNVSHFVVQRSTNVLEFENLESVSAFNNSIQNSYSSIDQHPVSGKSFYRLKMVDKDGQYAYSSVLKIEFTWENSISIFPNPAHDFIIIKNQETFKQVQLFDMTGRKVKQFLPNASNRYSISGLSKGVYMLHLINRDDTVQTQKVVIE